MPTIPAPLYALVGVTDLATEKARALPVKLAEIEIKRFEPPTVDDAKAAVADAKAAVSKIDLAKLDPRKVELPSKDTLNVELPTMADLDPRKVELPKFELSDFAARAFELAAVAEKKYDGLVVRGERVVASVRGTEHVSVPAPTVAEPTTPAAAEQPATPKATKPATKKATKPAAKKTEPEA